MIPAAIGSERKRYMPMATPISNTNDWSSGTKRTNSFFHNLFFNEYRFILEPYATNPYIQQKPIPLASDYQQQSMHDYTR